MMKKSGQLFSLFLFLFSFSAAVFAGSSDYPVFVAKSSNPNDYNLLASSGWDGNWYVGFNTCWMKKLPPIPPGDYTHAYLGVKLGRAKLKSVKGSWDKQPVPGTIYMAISSTGAWTREHSYFVTRTEDIPLEGDAQNAVEGTGEAQWFWAEVPLKLVNLKGDNYIALFSPTEELNGIGSSPVVAATWGGKEQDTWLAREGIRGAPPREPRDPLGTPISFYQPAIALKLIPKGSSHSLSVHMLEVKPSTPDHPKPVVTARVEGDSVESVWVEYYIDLPPNTPNPRGIPLMNHTWAKLGRPVWEAPYSFSLDLSSLPPGKVQLRVAASNIWEERAASDSFTLDVPPNNAKK